MEKREIYARALYAVLDGGNAPWDHMIAFRKSLGIPDPLTANHHQAYRLADTIIAIQVTEPSDLRAALEDAYTFISQPQRMESPAGGPKTATYRVEGYNALTAKIRRVLGR